MDTSTEGSRLKDGGSRIFWLDIARFIAIISITMNHAVNRTLDIDYVLMHMTYLDIDTIIRVALYVISRLGAVIFFMITGALILKKRFNNFEDVKAFYKNNLLKILITSEFWFVITYWYIVLTGDPEYEPIQGITNQLLWMIRTMLFDDTYTFASAWYIFDILAIYSVLPLISMAIHQSSIKSLYLPMLIVIVSSIIVPNINEIFLLMNSSHYIIFAIEQRDVFARFLPYVIIGYMIAQGYFNKIPIIFIRFCALLFFCLSIMYTIWYGQSYFFSDVSYSHIYIFITSICLFEDLYRVRNKLATNMNGYFSRLIIYISKISFAIYFLHIIIMEGIKFDFGLISESVILNFMFYEASSVILSILIIYVLSHVKLLKKYLFMLKD